MVAVSGQPGSGRTTLLRDVVALLQRDAVWVDCSVFAHRTPWRSMHEAVSSTSPQVFPAEMAAELADRLAASPAPDEIGALIWSVISSGVPVMGDQVVVLDDFDLLDPASQGVASYLLQRVAQFGRVPVVVSVASGGEPVGGHVATVDIDPLTTDEVRVLVEDLIEDPVPYRVADGLCGGTGGNLLAVVEAVGRLTAEQLKGRDLLPHPLPLGNSAAQRLLRAAGRDGVPGRRELMAALAVDPYVTVDQARAAGGVGVRRRRGHGSRIDRADPPRSSRLHPRGGPGRLGARPRASSAAACTVSWPTARTPGAPRCIARSPAMTPRRSRPSRRPRSATDSAHPGHVAMALDAVELVAARLGSPGGPAVDGRRLPGLGPSDRGCTRCPGSAPDAASWMGSGAGWR